MLEINLLGSAVDGRATLQKRAPAGGAAVGAPAAGPTTLLAGVGLLLVLWVGYTFWSTGARATELEQELQKEAADSTSLASVIGRSELLRARQDTIQHKINVIASVDGRRYVWPHLLDEISRAVPAFTWLTKLSAAEAVEPTAASPSAAAPAAAAPVAPAPAESSLPHFSIEGGAANTQALTRFMRNLEMSPYIAGVTLVTSAQQVTDGRAFQKFTLEARYEQPDSARVRTLPVVAAE